VMENLLLIDVTCIQGGGEGGLMYFFPRIWPTKCRDTVCIRTLSMLLVKMILRVKKVKIFLRQTERHTQTCGTAEVTLHALLRLPTDGGEWLASQTRHFNPRRKYFKIFLDLTMCNWWVIPDIKKNIVSVTSTVISPWIKSLTWDWNETQILWLPCWQPSHYAGWGVIIQKCYTK
jgi:hypothetical protein